MSQYNLKRQDTMSKYINGGLRFQDNVVNQANVLRIAPVSDTSSGESKHMYGKVTFIPVDEKRRFAGFYTDVKVTRKIIEQELQNDSFSLSYNSDELRKMGEANFGSILASDERKISVRKANVFESNKLEELFNYCEGNHGTTDYGVVLENRLIDAGGTTADKQSRILVVTWNEDLQFLRNPQMGGGFPGVDTMETPVIYRRTRMGTAAEPITLEESNGKVKVGIRFLYDFAIDLHLNAPLQVVTIVNVEADITVDKAEEVINDAVKYANPQEGAPTIIMNDIVANKTIYKMKSNVLNLFPEDTDHNIVVRSVNGIPVIETKNMPGFDQAVVTVS